MYFLGAFVPVFADRKLNTCGLYSIRFKGDAESIASLAARL
jgi:hypothetical protein